MPDIFDANAHVYIKTEGKLGRIVLNRLARKNALTQAMWNAIPDAVSVLNDMPDVSVIILCSSSDSAFAAGADLKELQEISKDPARCESNRVALRDAQRALARSPKPVIAEIAGPCMGGGCGLAIHCDFRIASTNAKFGVTPAKLGIIYPLNDTKELMDLVGVSNTKKLLFTAQHINGAQALEIGLIDQLVSPEMLHDVTEAFAAQMTAVSQYSIRGMKWTIQQILDGQIDDDDETAAMFCAAHEGEDAIEGMNAFLEKRKPNFRWTHPAKD
ncbi:enoyl-CoA hydratase/isomerase family protein [Kordiimonas aquimaris]|uniref:enoyl-CoA hydratase/isomerase family protein n=1 Tax=Kordiimonas aquimaris TaxID=707591 RepID=UPI0021CE67C9|nr:enoyl-CoA hydratase/isomerase family protein [Kordiimonas aquimaris]